MTTALPPKCQQSKNTVVFTIPTYEIEECGAPYAVTVTQNTVVFPRQKKLVQRLCLVRCSGPGASNPTGEPSAANILDQTNALQLDIGITPGDQQLLRSQLDGEPMADSFWTNITQEKVLPNSVFLQPSSPLETAIHHLTQKQNRTQVYRNNELPFDTICRKQ